MWPYDSDGFDPPAPVFEAVLRLRKEVQQTVLMQVDSGADLSCIPERIVPSSGPLRYGLTYVAGYEGEVAAKKTVFISIRFGEYRFDNIEVLPISGRIGLIGRDLLNSLEVTLDGPNRTLFVDGH